jgi:RHS repeat-associated protein
MKNKYNFGLIIAVAGSLVAAANAQESESQLVKQIEQAPGFQQRLVWLGKTEPDKAQDEQLLGIMNNLQSPSWMGDVESFLTDYPKSPWAASLHNAYASFCRETGRTTTALEHWEAAWTLVKDDDSAPGRKLGGSILANWTDLLSSLGRLEKLKKLIPSGDQWHFANPQDRNRFEGAKNSCFLMQEHPEIAYRCGTFALKAVGESLQPTNRGLDDLVDVPSPTNGFSMANLLGLAKRHGMNMLGVRRTQGQDLIVPSVVHWRQNHYAAILQRQGDIYLVSDPTFGQERWMPADVINEEASGEFLVPARLPQQTGWKQLSRNDMEAIHGMGLPNSIKDGGDKLCNSFCPDCHGMPTWGVSEPYVNLWIVDQPLSYLTSRGEAFTFSIAYKQRDTRPIAHTWPSLNTAGWNNSWSSYVHLQSILPCGGECYVSWPNAIAVATIFLANGGEVDFAPLQTYDQSSRISLQLESSSTFFDVGLAYGANGLRAVHADGSQDIYELIDRYPALYGGYAEADCLLTRHIDPHGNTTWFYYSNGPSLNYDLVNVVDYDGRTNTLQYTSNELLSEVDNPYGLQTKFKYDANENLTNIVDAAGISSSITYDTTNNPTQLVTPYGTNTFVLIDNGSAGTNSGEGNFGNHNLVDRAVQVTDPVGATRLYAYRYDCSAFMATNFSSSDVPTGTPIGTLDTGTGGTNNLANVCYRNSFFWDPRQYANLSTTDVSSFDANDYLRGRMRHWLQDTNELYVTDRISVERDASPDGSIEGLKNFYDYQGKTYNHQVGTNAFPSVKAWRLPNGETHYEYFTFDNFGNITSKVTTYTKTDGSVGTRTNQFVYAVNTFTNAFGSLDDSGNLDYPIITTYTVPNLLTRVTAADGSNIWTYGGFDLVTWTNDFYLSTETNRVLQTSLRVLPDYATNGVGEVASFSYSGGTPINEYNLGSAVPGKSFTGYDKVTSVKSVTGLTTTNIYDANNFLSRTIDLEIARTNGFGYTDNGLVQYQTNELGRISTNTWDALLRLTSSADARGYLSNRYDKLDIVGERDRLGNWRTYGFDGDDHLVAYTNELTQKTFYSWCGCGALESITNAVGEVTQFTYDLQSRPTTITLSPSIYYSLSYDLSGRLTNAIDGAGVTLLSGYNNQGDFTGLTNAYGPIYQAIYDIRDRPMWVENNAGVWTTNTYDALDRLLTRQTAVGNAERFGYGTTGLVAYTNQIDDITRSLNDPAGRLILLTNQNQEVLQFAYDPASNLTNMIDGKNQKTSWQFDVFSRTTNTVDDVGNTSFRFSYDADNQITNRWTPEKLNAGYSWDAAGRLTNTTYASSPTISAAYDALGRITNLIDAVGTNIFGYSRLGKLAIEDGPWASDTVSNYFGAADQLQSISIAQPSLSAWTQSFLYDTAGRMTNVTSSAGAFGYSYVGASPLVQVVMLGGAGAITNVYDVTARLTNTKLLNSQPTTINSFGYAYNGAGWRTEQTNFYGDYWNYGYDGIGQLTSAFGYEGGGATRAQEQLGYAYDKAWNLAGRTNNGFAEVFTNDTRNELTNVTHTGTYTVAGGTYGAPTSVTVNGSAATVYADGSYERSGVSVSDGNNTFTAQAQDAHGHNVSQTATAWFAANAALKYDLNGNLTNDSHRAFFYDDENQLTNVTIAGVTKSEFAYDGLHRRRIRKEYSWTGSWVKTNEVWYVYYGNLVMQERDANNAPLVTYTRGKDLSGRMQGAGGIGGLLARTDGNGSVYYHVDGNGNISCLTDTSGAVVARYEYDPYGNMLAMDGPMADMNLYRFSSKEWSANVGLYYFGFRFYDPNSQRWLNRDPIAEAGGFNLYNFVGNNPANNFDLHGLAWVLFDGQAWGQLARNVFYGPDYQNPTPDPSSYIAQRGVSPIATDENGVPIPPGDFVQNKVVLPALGQAAMLPMGPEEEEAEAAGGLWNALKNKMCRFKRAPKVPNFKELEAALDATGRVHGLLPNPQELGQYHPEDLQKLLDELKQSVQQRIQNTSNLGSTVGHDARQAEEQQLINAIEKHLQQ